MLTPAQLETLRADILTHSELDAARLAGDDIALAAYYNANATPDFVVWKSAVSQDEIMQNGFDWTRVDNLTVGKARIWEWLFSNATRSINPSKSNVRSGIDSTWVGTAADLAVRNVVYGHCKRKATVLEKLFSTGTGSTVSPAILGVEGKIGYAEISGAR